MLEAMTDTQKTLFEAYQDAMAAVCGLDQQALFPLTWAAAHELL
ncbi:MAG: hypothetical protein Q4C45_07595 [Oscillospiraceae bacterium]|nr:hypothetical protein [Oscillospiraceae bacterium]